MKRKILAVVLCGIMALSLGACGSKDNGGSAKTDDGSAKKEASGGETYNWQIGNVLSADQPWDLGLNKFAELLSEYSDGRITATVQSGGTLGSEIEMLEAVQMGTLDMSIASTPSLSGFTDCMIYRTYSKLRILHGPLWMNGWDRIVVRHWKVPDSKDLDSMIMVSI